MSARASRLTHQPESAVAPGVTAVVEQQLTTSNTETPESFHAANAASRPWPAWRSLVVLLAVLGVGIALRVWGLGWGLENATVSRRPHPDEWVLYWLFHWFDSSGTANPCPRAGSQCFLDWGMAFPYLSWLTGQVASSWTHLVTGLGFGPQADPGFIRPVLAGRLTSVLASSGTIVASYFLGRRAFGEATGLVTATIVALSALLIQLAHFATPDSLTSLLLTCALVTILRAAHRPGMAAFVLAGAAGGLAMASEYHMALLGAPIATALLLSPARRAAWLGGAAAAGLVVFLAINPYVVVDFPAFVDASLHTLRVRTVDSGIQYGARWAPYGPAWLFEVRYGLGFGVGLPLTAVMLCGAIVAVVRRRQADLILLSWIAPYFVMITLSPAKFLRYGAPLLIPLAVLAASALVELWKATGLRRRLVLTTLAGIASLYTATYDAAYAGLFSSTDPRVAAANLMAARLPNNATIGFESPYDGLVNMPAFLGNGGYNLCFPTGGVEALFGLPYVVIDRYSLDEATTASRDALLRFEQRVATSRNYRLVARFAYEPTFLGVTFGISGSPHDWRYASHEISIYADPAIRRHGTDGTRMGAAASRPAPARALACTRSR